MTSQVQNFSMYYKCSSNRLNDALQTLTSTERKKSLSLVPVSSTTPEFFMMIYLPYHSSSLKICRVPFQKLQQSFSFLPHYLPPSLSIHSYKTVSSAVLWHDVWESHPVITWRDMVLAPLFTPKLTIFLSQGIAWAFVLGLWIYGAGLKFSENIYSLVLGFSLWRGEKGYLAPYKS